MSERPILSHDPILDGSVTAEDTATPADETFEVRQRGCDKGYYGPEWKLRLSAQCRRDSDCPSTAVCYGAPERTCVYRGVEALPSEPCEEDRNCSSDGDGVCARFLFSACQYEFCRADADCPEGRNCVCPPDHDRYECVVDGCQDQHACPPGEQCRVDESIVGPYAISHCTTAADECRDDGDCTEPPRCGYDISRKRWSCTGIIIVD